MSDVLVDAKPVCRDYEPHPCSCQPPAGVEPGCTEMCLNRSDTVALQSVYLPSDLMPLLGVHPTCKQI